MSRDEFMVSDERLLPVFDDAGHVDEGTVHAWLDEAFDAAAATQVERHVAACAACAAMVAEARGLVAASSRVLGALDVSADGVQSAMPNTFPSTAPAAVETRAAAARVVVGMRPQWWWRAAAGLFVVIGGTVLLRQPPREASVPPAAASPVAKRDVASPSADTPTVAAARAAEPVAAEPVAAEPVAARPRAADAATAAAPTLAAVEAPAASPVSAEQAAVERSAEGITMRLTGVVRDATGAQSIASALVSVTAPGGVVRQSTTDAFGRFTVQEFTVTRGARVDYRVRAIGYQQITGSLFATSDSQAISVRLAPSVLALEAATISAPAEPRKSAALPATVMPVAASPTAGAAISRMRQLASAPTRDMAMPMSGTVRDARAVASREQYDRIEDNPFLGVRTNPLSTFSIDVDRASYGNVRRFLTSGQRPPKDAVRIEELINYFPYELPEPRGSDPVAITSEVMTAPWQPQHRLVRIGLQARRIETASLPPNNLVFLVDVSGSMNEWNKLPLVKQSLRLLVNALRPQDRVAIVAYAGAAGLVLPSTSGDEKARIADAIDRLEAGGSTAGGAGIELAYRTAREHFLERGNNRVILATDGDFNVGVSSDAELERLVEQRRRDGTYLTVLGFGTGNYQAAKMEKLAKVGNGNAGYVDSPAEARKLLVEEMGATLLTVANDVKLQVEFNPSRVQAYRLIGYENRLLSTEDFNDDAKDAGDIGTGHQVTALYEVVPVGVDGTVPVRGMDSLRYVAPDATVRSTTRGPSDELLFVKLRYKRPGNLASQLLSHAVPSRISARPSTDARFIAAVASFGMLLRDSEYKGNSSAAQVLEQARAALGEDRGGYRAEFVGLVERWRALGVTAGERR